MKSGSIKPILTTLGQAVRQRRVELGLSQESFAERVGLHRTYVGSIERGERNVSLVNLQRIAEALALRPSELLMLAEKDMVDGGQ